MMSQCRAQLRYGHNFQQDGVLTAVDCVSSPESILKCNCNYNSIRGVIMVEMGQLMQEWVSDSQSEFGPCFLSASLVDLPIHTVMMYHNGLCQISTSYLRTSVIFRTVSNAFLLFVNYPVTYNTIFCWTKPDCQKFPPSFCYWCLQYLAIHSLKLQSQRLGSKANPNRTYWFYYCEQGIWLCHLK